MRIPGSTAAGSRTLSESVNPNSVTSVGIPPPSMPGTPIQPGIRRSAPSRNRMYQSGWVPAEIGEGSYGP